MKSDRENEEEEEVQHKVSFTSGDVVVDRFLSHGLSKIKHNNAM